MSTLINNIEIIFGCFALILSVWAAFQKQIKHLFALTFRLEEAKLTVQERYDKYKDEQMEKMLKTMRSYQQASERQQAQLNDLQELLAKKDVQIATARQQTIEQKHIIDNLQEIIESDRSYLKEMKMVLKKYEVHIRYLQKLLRTNQVKFKEMDI